MRSQRSRDPTATLLLDLKSCWLHGNLAIISYSERPHASTDGAAGWLCGQTRCFSIEGPGFMYSKESFAKVSEHTVLSEKPLYSSVTFVNGKWTVLI